MPKILSGSPISSLSKNDSRSILKKNQACHQCRRRKLKCDAKLPCSTCVRSHSYALAHAQEGSHLPLNPECTFDEVPEVGTPETYSETPRNEHEHLESRILELEALLKEKQDLITSFAGSSTNLPQSFISSSRATPHSLSIAVSVPASKSFDSFGAGGYADPSILNDSSSVAGMLEGFIEGIPAELGVLWPKWPQHLPRPDLLRHIVDSFFAFHLHATRLLNMSTFLTSLSLPPDHPDFPSPPVLHAVCAVGSLYTVANRQQLGSGAPDFAEQQVMYAKNEINRHLMSGQKPLQCLQATIILSWYYWIHARWIELFISTGQSLRIAVPLGLNLCPPFHALNTTAESMSIIPAPLTLAEDETRRNVFWLAYTIDRQYGAGNGWAVSLDDNDIAQLLPLPRGKLDAGISSADRRQWSHLRESYFVHPPELTDSFTLYIKVMLVISRIKNFNHRFRVMEHLGDPGSKSTRMNRWNEPDVRSTTTFSQLDNLVFSFRSSLSHEFKDPLVNNCVDPHLYTTHLALHASIILLHEPHSNAKSSICTSAMKILHAARGILELVFVVLSTNYDLGLLDPFCPFCWFLAGRVFARFLKAAQDASSTQQIDTLQVELEFIRTTLGKMGERMPLSGEQ
ncbi:hypothetical protein HD554DRAFT_2063701 [Boletus coccyginus]|nr:hypothetical protein HD554DRAFT_2063701 [Boletus coccyginus]